MDLQEQNADLHLKKMNLQRQNMHLQQENGDFS